jgi:hypothetical protein
MPTAKDPLVSFLGAVGFLTPDCKGVRILMAVLTPTASSKSTWRWGPTEQQAFQQVKDIVVKWRDHYHKPLEYGDNTAPVHLTCDALLVGAGGVISQGENHEKARIVAFWSMKFNSVQQNYPVHDHETLAIVESLKRFKHLLLGMKFFIWTDHKPLLFIKMQMNLSLRQMRWMEVIVEFDFEMKYLPGEKNMLVDLLSRIHSNEATGIIRSESEYIQEERVLRNELTCTDQITTPLYTMTEA